MVFHYISGNFPEDPDRGRAQQGLDTMATWLGCSYKPGTGT